jgi:UDP-2,4-diacetamido-2,4,6-trideoxy-beta-L-altropyranose hydrolase
MRCLALAQAWQDRGGRAVFAMGEATASIRARLKSEEIAIIHIACAAGTREEADETAKLSVHEPATCVVVDGYRFDAEYQRALVDAGLKILFVDDNSHCDYYSANLVLNQNVHAKEGMYRRRASNVKLLLGLKYALLRREYARAREWQRQIPAVARKLLVTMGGSDAENFSLQVLKAIPFVAIEGMNARLIIGGSSPHRACLQENASRIGGYVELLNDVRNMAEVIAWADVAIAAAGSVSWEVCVLGLPSLLIPVADNQIGSATELERCGAARILQPDVATQQIADNLRELMLSAAGRRALSENARALLDGDGSQRVVDAILSSRD